MSIDTRKVAVMMPFGGSLWEYSRRSILHFKRIEYIIESRLKERISTASDHNAFITYQVERFDAAAGILAEKALRMINEADIVIGLVTEQNVNVAFELAFRSIIQDLPIMIVADSDKSLLPVYFGDVALLDYPVADSPIGKQIEAIAANPQFDVGLRIEIPQELKKQIDGGQDGKLEGDLIAALQRIEVSGPQGQLDVVPYVPAPPRSLGEWDTYYPTSVIETKWYRIGEHRKYDENYMVSEPQVVYCNDEFLRLYNLRGGIEKNKALTLGYLLERLEGLVIEGTFARFIDDQQRLTREIVFEDGFGKARIPIHLRLDHPLRDFQGKVLLPCLISKWADKIDLTRPHRVYLVVAYIDISDHVAMPEREVLLNIAAP